MTLRARGLNAVAACPSIVLRILAEVERERPRYPAKVSSLEQLLQLDRHAAPTMTVSRETVEREQRRKEIAQASIVTFPDRSSTPV